MTSNGRASGGTPPDDGFSRLPISWGQPQRQTSPVPVPQPNQSRRPALTGSTMPVRRSPAWRPPSLSLDAESKFAPVAVQPANEPADPAPRNPVVQSRYARWFRLHPLAGLVIHIYTLLFAVWAVVYFTGLSATRPIQSVLLAALDGLAWAVGRPAIGVPAGLVVFAALLFGLVRLLAAAGGFNRCRSCEAKIALLTFMSICDACSRLQDEQLVQATAAMKKSFESLRVLTS